MTVIEKTRIQKCFSRAAKTYDQNAFLQKKVADQLVKYFNPSTLIPSSTILDLGCGTGYSLPALRNLFPEAGLWGLDLSLAQCHEAFSKNSGVVINGDFDALPFSNQSFDRVFSSLTLQWSVDLSHSLKEIARILKDGGLLAFSILGEGSLKELTRAKSPSTLPSSAREEGSKRDPSVIESLFSPRFLPFHETLSHLKKSGFTVTLAKQVSERFFFDHPLEVIRSLKAVGANHLSSSSSTLSGKRTFDRLIKNYEKDPLTGRYPLTYEVHYFVARKE